MKKIIVLGLVALLSLFASCGKGGVDVASPFMEIISLTPSPSASDICGTQEDTVFHLRGGEDLRFDVVFKDDAGLSQYKIDIHNNFDCHGHGAGTAPGVTVPNVDQLTIDWSVLDIQDLFGENQTISRTLSVPENVTAGNYHFQVQVLDEAGNDNPLANFYALKILNPKDEVTPVISINEPANAAFSVAEGEQIVFKGTVTDNYSLSEGGNGILFLSYTDLSSGNTFSTNAVEVFDNSVDTIFNFELSFQVPTTLKKGAYLFTLGANDGVRNIAEHVVFEVEITD